MIQITFVKGLRKQFQEGDYLLLLEYQLLTVLEWIAAIKPLQSERVFPDKLHLRNS